MSIEFSVHKNKFDSIVPANHENKSEYSEIERKFMPKHPLTELRERAVPVEQVYLSHPSEDFNLRLREMPDAQGQMAYTATLKDKGEITENGLARLEIETEISPEIYHYYAKSNNYPRLYKLRASPQPGIVIDFYDDNSTVVELEYPEGKYQSLIDECGNDLIDVTGTRMADNERRAHKMYLHDNDGLEMPDIARHSRGSRPTRTIARWLLTTQQLAGSCVATVAGRSGSGKSTLVRELQTLFADAEPTLTVATLSTDDYHRGKAWLEAYNNGQAWTDWDNAIVYDIEALRRDIETLASGKAVSGRRFNFGTQEPEECGTILPADITLVEGIYAGHPIFEEVANMRHEVTTPLATCIGRRLLRDFTSDRANDSMGDPAQMLRYLLENAEPTYRAQPGQNRSEDLR